MIRVLLYLVFFWLLYGALRTVIRSAVAAYRRDDDLREARMGRDMVQDPQCRTYIVKDRAVARRISGSTLHFCSTTCADEYARRLRS